MQTIQDKLIDAYAYEMKVAECSFQMMGKLLDVLYVKNRIDLFDLRDIYIYGGGYLGIQFYNAVKNHEPVRTLAIIDKKGKLSVEIPEIPVVNLEKFEEIYNGQKIIVASVRYFSEIERNLSSFVSTDRILFLGEFLGGIAH